MELSEIRSDFSASHSSALREAKKRIKEIEKEHQELQEYIRVLEALPPVLTKADESYHAALRTIRNATIEILKRSRSPMHVREIAAEIRRLGIPSRAESLEKSIDATLIQMRNDVPVEKVAAMTWVWTNGTRESSSA